MNEALRLDNLEKKVEAAQSRIEQLENRRLFNVRLQTFAPEPFKMLKEIEVAVEFDGDDFLASFTDANLNAAGCNEAEVIENLKDNILSAYEYLDPLPAEKLAKPLQKQITVLREFVSKIAQRNQLNMEK